MPFASCLAITTIFNANLLSVISAPESQLEILLEGIDSVEDADWLGIDGEISDHIAADINNYIKTHTKTEKQQPILSSNIPSAYKIREELEAVIIADLLGSAGGEDEELDEKSVSDRYLVGLLAPQHRRITEETIEKSPKGLPIKKIPKNFLWCGTKSPLIIKDGQDAHPTKLGNLFFVCSLRTLLRRYCCCNYPGVCE